MAYYQVAEEMLKNKNSPDEAHSVGNSFQLDSEQIKQWNSKKDIVMEKAVRAKFSYPAFKDLLLSTVQVYDDSYPEVIEIAHNAYPYLINN